MEGPPRIIRFSKAQIVPFGDRSRALVELQHPGGSCSGAAEADGGTPLQAMEATARATVQALCQGVGVEESAVRLTGIQEINAFGHKAVLVFLIALHEGRVGSLLGVCMMGEDPRRAAAHAVLNAANRFFGVG